MTDQEILGAAMAYTDKHGGGGGTSDYSQLTNKPQINGTTLIGNKSASDLSLASTSDLAGKVDKVEGKVLSTNDYTDADKAIVGGVTAALAGKQDTLTFDDVPTANSDNPVKSGGVKSAIDAAVASAYHHAGTKTCAELVAGLLVAANEGNVYNMTDSGTTTADFIEGAGQPIKAGDNVGVAKISDGVYKFDLLSGFVDTTNFVQKSQTAGLLKNDGTVNDEIEGDVDSLKSGLTTLDDEVNGDATTYDYADVITIEDAVPANLADCSVKIEPVQDLHGQSAPYVGGAGKNKVHAKNYASDGYDGTTFNNVGSDQWIADDVTLPAGTYTYSLKLLSLPSADRSFSVYKSGDINTAYFNVTHLETVTVGRVYSGTFTLAEETTIVTRLWGNGGGEFKMQMQLEAGSTATDFAPYTNICPISGHTEASVQRDGRNWFDGEYVVAYLENGTTYKVTSATTRTAIVPIKGGQKYTIKKNGGTRFAICESSEYPLVGYKYTSLYFDDSATQATVTTSNSAKYLLIYVTNDGTEPQLQVELGETATPYEPYSGNTYTIALGDTIYGGTVDFDSGVMTVTHISASNTWGNMTNAVDRGEGITSKALSLGTVIINTPLQVGGLCNVTDNEVNNTLANIHWYTSDTNVIVFLPSDTDNDTLIQVLCQLATPTTIQLTPQQIQLLKGTNTLYASTGQISVTVNGVSGSIGAVQEQVNDHEERIEAVESYERDNTWRIEAPERKNHYDYNEPRLMYDANNTWWLNSSTNKIERGSSGNYTWAVKCNPNTTYTISLTHTSTVFRVAYGKMADLAWVTTSNTPQNIYGLQSNSETGDVSITITTGSDATYLFIQIGSSDADTAKLTMQVEVGNTKTAYTAYVPSVESRIEAVESKLITCKRTSVTRDKWYKIASKTINILVWIYHSSIIAFDGHLIKQVIYRSNNTVGFNNSDTKINAVYGNATKMGMVISADGKSLDLYIKANSTGYTNYTLLTDGQESIIDYFDPIETNLTDADMTITG